MRLGDQRIKQGIVHHERYVRDAAIRYFSESFSEDRSVMPLAIEAIESYGYPAAFSEFEVLQTVAQSDATIEWLVGEFNRLRSSADQSRFEYLNVLADVLAEADVALLKRHRRRLADLAAVPNETRARIAERTRLLAEKPAVCWREFEDVCQQLADPQRSGKHVLLRAYELVDAISHHPQRFSTEVARILAEPIERKGGSAAAWRQTCLIRAAGQMRLPATIAHLIRILQEPSEPWVHEDAGIALTQIGGEPVVKAVWNATATAGDGFLAIVAWILETLHCDLAVEAAEHFFDAADDVTTRIDFGHALLSLFAIDGISPVRQLLREQAANLEHQAELIDLRQALMAVCRLVDAELPELKEWESEYRAQQQQRDEWHSPDFEVVDTYTAGLNQPANPRPRSSSGPATAIPFPQKPRFRGVGRNDQCPCNSGKKYKHCCMRE